MIPKIIDMLSFGVAVGSAITVVPAAINNPEGVTFAAWATLVYLSGLWQLWRLKKARLNDGE